MNEFSSVESNNRVRVRLLKQCGKTDKLTRSERVETMGIQRHYGLAPLSALLMIALAQLERGTHEPVSCVVMFHDADVCI
jgi:hypothetical protein